MHHRKYSKKIFNHTSSPPAGGYAVAGDKHEKRKIGTENK